MKKDEYGLVEYESLDELIKAGIKMAYEDNSFYYVKVAPQSKYDNSMWRVNKKTGKVDCMFFTEFITRYADNTRPVNISKLNSK